MNTLKKRLAKMERVKQAMPMSREEIDRRVIEMLAAKGTSKEAVIAKHGSMGAYFHWLLCQETGEKKAEPQDGLTAAERYMAMLH